MMMTTMVSNKIQEIVNDYTKAIADKIANRYGIPRYELLELIRTLDGRSHGGSAGSGAGVHLSSLSSSSVSIPPKGGNGGTIKPVSAYVNFCNQHRSIVKQQKPELKFGEISKELGMIWRGMSSVEKAKYEQSPTSPSCSKRECVQEKQTHTKTTEQGESHQDVNGYTRESLSGMSIAEIRNICGQLQLKRTGKKEQLVEDILRTTTTKSSSPSCVREDECLVFYDDQTNSVTGLSDDDDVSTSSSFVIDDDDADDDF